MKEATKAALEGSAAEIDFETPHAGGTAAAACRGDSSASLLLLLSMAFWMRGGRHLVLHPWVLRKSCLERPSSALATFTTKTKAATDCPYLRPRPMWCRRVKTTRTRMMKSPSFPESLPSLLCHFQDSSSVGDAEAGMSCLLPPFLVPTYLVWFGSVPASECWAPCGGEPRDLPWVQRRAESKENSDAPTPASPCFCGVGSALFSHLVGIEQGDWGFVAIIDTADSDMESQGSQG